MMRAKPSQDEFCFPKEDRSIAEMLAAELPKIRCCGEELTGCQGPRHLQIILDKRPPSIGLIMRVWFAAIGRKSYGQPKRNERFFQKHGLKIIALLGLLSLTLGFYSNEGNDFESFLLRMLYLFAGFIGFLFLLIVLMVLKLWCLFAWRYYRHFSKAWANVGGLAFPFGPKTSLIALHWPRPPRQVFDVDLRASLEDAEAARSALAHEYAHCLLWIVRQENRQPPAWLDEGFAFWFSEKVLDLFATFELAAMYHHDVHIYLGGRFV